MGSRGGSDGSGIRLGRRSGGEKLLWSGAGVESELGILAEFLFALLVDVLGVFEDAKDFLALVAVSRDPRHKEGGRGS